MSRKVERSASGARGVGVGAVDRRHRGRPELQGSVRAAGPKRSPLPRIVRWTDTGWAEVDADPVGRDSGSVADPPDHDAPEQISKLERERDALINRLEMSRASGVSLLTLPIREAIATMTERLADDLAVLTTRLGAEPDRVTLSYDSLRGLNSFRDGIRREGALLARLSEVLDGLDQLGENAELMVPIPHRDRHEEAAFDIEAARHRVMGLERSGKPWPSG